MPSPKGLAGKPGEQLAEPHGNKSTEVVPSRREPGVQCGLPPGRREKRRPWWIRLHALAGVNEQAGLVIRPVSSVTSRPLVHRMHRSSLHGPTTATAQGPAVVNLQSGKESKNYNG